MHCLCKPMFSQIKNIYDILVKRHLSCISPFEDLKKNVLSFRVMILASKFNIFLSGFHRGSYMSAHILFNSLNKLRKRDKMQGLPSIYLSQRVYKFNNTGAWILDYIYHMPLKLF